jgi:hypothetical protein
MKKIISIACLVFGLAVSVYAAPPTSITNYYTGAVVIDNTFTNAGDTGLTVSNAYIAIPLSLLTNTEFTAQLVTNDVRPFISSMIKRLDLAIAALAATNQFSTFTVSEDVRYTSATNRTVFRAISEQQTITITPGYPAE